MDGLYDTGDYVMQEAEYLTHAGWENQIRFIGRTSDGRFLPLVCQVAIDGRFRPVMVWASDPIEIDVYLQER